MPSVVLARSFARRMLPLSTLCGLLVAAVPPLTFDAMGRRKLQAQANIYARQIGDNLAVAVYEEPSLWRYNAAKILQATMLHHHRQDVTDVRVHTCGGATIFQLRNTPADRQPPASPPRGQAPVWAYGGVAARVDVYMNDAEHRHHLWLLTLISVTTGLVMGLALYLYPTAVVRRQARHLAVTLRNLQAAKHELTVANDDLNARIEGAVGTVRELSRRVVSIQEEERGRISRDLHDGLGQAITAVQVALQVADSQPEQAARQLSEASRMCAQALHELRRVVRELRPTALQHRALPDVVQDYVADFEERTRIQASCRCSGNHPVPEQVAACLFRVLQEALTNVQRHAHAKEVGVHLHTDGTTATLAIWDDGQGFDPAAATEGVGLRGMRERCDLQGGTLILTSAVGSGTRVEAALPY